MSPYLDHTTLRFFNNSLASSPLLRSRRSNKRQEHHYCRQLLWKKKKHNNTSKRYRITQCKFDSYAFITNTFHTINANFRVVPPLKKKKKKPFFISSVTPQNSNASKRHIWSHIFGKYAIKSNSEVDASSTISVLYLMDLKLALHMPFFGCEQTEAHHKMVPRMYCTYADVVYPSGLSEIVRTRRRERWDR